MYASYIILNAIKNNSHRAAARPCPRTEPCRSHHRSFPRIHTTNHPYNHEQLVLIDVVGVRLLLPRGNTRLVGEAIEAVERLKINAVYGWEDTDTGMLGPRESSPD